MFVAFGEEPSLFDDRSVSKRILDLLLLLGAAFAVCVVGVAAFIVAEIRHINPLWVFFSGVSIVFLAGVREEYRKEFRSVRFVLFVIAWLLINMAVIFVVLGSLGWLYLVPILIAEQALFYLSAEWLFDVQPRSHR